jgi:UDP-N-acetyl-D-mannosaminuronic acid dehydrogenase
MELCVIGLGAVGLPLAAWCAARGALVWGVEVDAARREAIACGEAARGEFGLAEVVASALTSEALRVVGSLDEVARRVDQVMICVGTREALGEQDGLSSVREVVASLSRWHATTSAQIALVSTSPPGTTRALVGEALAGVAPAIAYCPERVAPGRALADLDTSVRLVGGLSERDTALVAATWQRLGASVQLATAEEAEAAKLIENASRYANIALANELADWAASQHIDAARAFDLARSHPRVHLLSPGVGIGGLCLPMSVARIQEHFDAPLISIARRTIDALPSKIARDLVALLGPDARVALLGATYKADSTLLRASPALALLQALRDEGIHVILVEPAHPDDVPLERALHQADALILAVAHSRWLHLDPTHVAPLMRGRLVVDLCRVWDAPRWRAAGFLYTGRGLPQPQAASNTSDARSSSGD